MSFVHAFCVLLFTFAALDYLIFTMKKAPKSATMGIKYWIMGFLCGVFELGWWFF